MERSLAKLIKELKSRPATPEETTRLIDVIEGQEKQAKIADLRKRLKALQG